MKEKFTENPKNYKKIILPGIKLNKYSQLNIFSSVSIIILNIGNCFGVLRIYLKTKTRQEITK